MTHRILVTGARPVAALGARVGEEPVDLLIEGGRITRVAPGLRVPGAEVIDAGGAFAIPGLWDGHVHMSQWAAVHRRIDLADTSGPEDVLARVAEHLASEGEGGDRATLVEGFGWRLAGWSRLPGTAALDGVCGDRPVVLISGDCHGGWLSSAAYRALGVPVREGHVDEDDWFELWARLDEIPQDEDAISGSMRRAMTGAAAKGVIGLVDFEISDGRLEWPARVARGLDLLRVRTAVYTPELDGALAAGVRTGDVLDELGLITMGPLKVISDGSLNTRTAYCCDPFVSEDDLAEPRGKSNIAPEELAPLLRRAQDAGLEVAVHAIGDAALADALTAIESSGARGSIEHVQLARPAEVSRMAALGLVASVQPAHLLDDREISEALWSDRLERCFPFGELRDAGITLRLGSDAPVAPLDPWLAMAAAVHRSADQRPPWSPAHALTPAQALLASTDGQRLRPGDRGDVVLLDGDPFADIDISDAAATADVAARLSETRVQATVLDGRITFGG
ncbi:amidohydrolase family protein [Marihabitans asiaticum]|uniref:Amidohydrolase 3 domain-containing protein n=1 Tax=Marihabitans asiaticum TaxID=415218 RepID=A0A560WEC0_9MICO|nr:amidohydrolase family protein [Marihabitans asiaticum]TWD16019.1 hypothetical protein FB557_1560 [Marihabitans asiaticum]